MKDTNLETFIYYVGKIMEINNVEPLIISSVNSFRDTLEDSEVLNMLSDYLKKQEQKELERLNIHSYKGDLNRYLYTITQEVQKEENKEEIEKLQKTLKRHTYGVHKYSDLKVILLDLKELYSFKQDVKYTIITELLNKCFPI